MEIRFTDMTIIKNPSNVGIQDWQDFQRKNINTLFHNSMEFKNRIRIVFSRFFAMKKTTEI